MITVNKQNNIINYKTLVDNQIYGMFNCTWIYFKMPLN